MRPRQVVVLVDTPTLAETLKLAEGEEVAEGHVAEDVEVRVVQRAGGPP